MMKDVRKASRFACFACSLLAQLFHGEADARKGFCVIGAQEDALKCKVFGQSFG